MLRRWGRRFVSWHAAGPICAYVGMSLVVALFVDNTTSRIAAQNSLGTARSLSSARITRLNDEILRLERQDRRAAKQRQRLLDEVQVLTKQLHSLHTTPLFTPEVAPSPSQTPVGPRSRGATGRPSNTPTGQPTIATPQPSRSPSVAPSPTRTCDLLHPVACL